MINKNHFMTPVVIILSALALTACSGNRSRQAVDQQVHQGITVTQEPVTVYQPMPQPAPVYRPAPVPQPQRPVSNRHSHPAVPGCTRSVTHAHPGGQNRQHKHRYSCQRNVTPNRGSAHHHNICGKNMSHTHPGANRGHQHRSSCQRNVRRSNGSHSHNVCGKRMNHNHPGANHGHQHRSNCYQPTYRQPIYSPKAKGVYRGSINIDRDGLQTYQQ